MDKQDQWKFFGALASIMLNMLVFMSVAFAVLARFGSDGCLLVEGKFALD